MEKERLNSVERGENHRRRAPRPPCWPPACYKPESGLVEEGEAGKGTSRCAARRERLRRRRKGAQAPADGMGKTKGERRCLTGGTHSSGRTKKLVETVLALIL